MAGATGFEPLASGFEVWDALNGRSDRPVTGDVEGLCSVRALGRGNATVQTIPDWHGP